MIIDTIAYLEFIFVSTTPTFLLVSKKLNEIMMLGNSTDGSY